MSVITVMKRALEEPDLSTALVYRNKKSCGETKSCSSKKYILTTKSFETEVSMDSTIHLVVPAKYTTPRIKSEQGSSSKFRVLYWDVINSRQTSRGFLDKNAAESYINSLESTTGTKYSLKISEILEDYKHYVEYYRIMPLCTEYTAQSVPLDPRMLGLWLGDGSSNAPQITSVDSSIIDYWSQYATEHGLKVTKNKITYSVVTGVDSQHRGSLVDKKQMEEAVSARKAGMTFKNIQETFGYAHQIMKKYIKIEASGQWGDYFERYQKNPLLEALRTLNVLKNKHIPQIYKENSRGVRLAVLGGIIDTDGYLDKGGYDICMANRTLCEDISGIASSLGFHVTKVKQVDKMCTNAKGGPKRCTAFRFRISGGPELRDIPLLLQYKSIKKDCKQRYDQEHFTITNAL
jgi:hypothetical protein